MATELDQHPTVCCVITRLRRAAEAGQAPEAKTSPSPTRPGVLWCVKLTMPKLVDA